MRLGMCVYVCVGGVCVCGVWMVSTFSAEVAAAEEVEEEEEEEEEFCGGRARRSSMLAGLSERGKLRPASPAAEGSAPIPPCGLLVTLLWKGNCV